MDILCWLINAYLIICVARIIFSFLPEQNYDNAIISMLHTVSYAATEPIFGTVRKAMPRIGDLPIDFSPMVVFIALGLIRSLLGC